MEQRLQKVLAEAGIGSRRTCEEYILQRRIRVNKKVINTLGFKVDVEQDVIEFDDERIKTERKFYFAFNKPREVICSSEDSFGRKKIIDYFEKVCARLYTVGRLDINSEGLIFVTNDGSFSNAVMHPREKIEKIYLVQINTVLSEKEIIKLEKGLWYNGGKSLPARVYRPVVKVGKRYQVKVAIFEGKKRQLRKMFEALGHRVKKLKRVQIGCVSIGNLKPGEFRPLTDREIAYFTKTK